MILRPGEPVHAWALSNPETNEIPLSLICASRQDIDALEQAQRICRPQSPYTERVELLITVQPK